MPAIYSLYLLEQDVLADDQACALVLAKSAEEALDTIDLAEGSLGRIRQIDTMDLRKCGKECHWDGFSIPVVWPRIP